MRAITDWQTYVNVPALEYMTKSNFLFLSCKLMCLCCTAKKNDNSRFIYSLANDPKHTERVQINTSLLYMYSDIFCWLFTFSAQRKHMKSSNCCRKSQKQEKEQPPGFLLWFGLAGKRPQRLCPQLQMTKFRVIVDFFIFFFFILICQMWRIGQSRNKKIWKKLSQRSKTTQANECGQST